MLLEEKYNGERNEKGTSDGKVFGVSLAECLRREEAKPPQIPFVLEL